MGRLGRIVSLLILIIVVADRRIVYADDSVRLMVGRSTVVNVGAPIARVSLTTADIADAIVTSPSELLINGKLPGTISMFVWDRAGAIKKYEVVVQRDLARLSEQVEQLFPGEKIEVRSNGKDIVLSGTVRDKAVIEKAINLAAGYVDKKDEVVNLLTLQAGAPSNQVLLKVRFAEVSRTALTELGASLFTSPTGVKNTIGRVTTGQFPSVGYDSIQYSKANGDFGSAVTDAQGKFTFSDFLNLFFFNEKYDLGATIKALQTRGLFQSLAEPNLVAESGKEASFLAGGEIPIPIAQPNSGGVAITIQFKEFGIRLTFTPTVNGDRVHLKVRPEVSSLDFANAIVLQGFRIPALTTRRTETELELQNGQTFAIAGLINNSMNKTLQKIPGIGDIPILGLLFQSQAAQKDRTELVVMITPQILPNNSPGVTPNLPRPIEPYLQPVPPKKSLDNPPVAFTDARGSAARPPVVTQTVPTAPATNATATMPVDPATAANAVQALTPNTRPVINGDALPATAQVPAAQPPRPLTPQEQKMFERARQQEAEAAKVRQKRDLEEAKRQEQINRNAQEAAAKRNAELAKKQAEIAKKQAEEDKKKQKEVVEAEKKLKAAQAAYDAEVAKTKKQQQ
jgi:pilus assembly protein CpaC